MEVVYKVDCIDCQNTLPYFKEKIFQLAHSIKYCNNLTIYTFETWEKTEETVYLVFSRNNSIVLHVEGNRRIFERVFDFLAHLLCIMFIFIWA